jgi:hypothetical protein
MEIESSCLHFNGKEPKISSLQILYIIYTAFNTHLISSVQMNDFSVPVVKCTILERREVVILYKLVLACVG